MGAVRGDDLPGVEFHTGAGERYWAGGDKAFSSLTFCLSLIAGFLEGKETVVIFPVISLPLVPGP